MKEKTATIAMVVSVLLLTGCQAPKPAALSDEQVVQTADNFMQATQAGDYPAASRDFSDPMKSAYTEAQFNQLRDLLREASGNYTSCAGAQPSLSNNQGYAVYRLTCKFEKESVVITITFTVGGDKVEGLFFDSVNLRKLIK